jgi:hypothetical protein
VRRELINGFIHIMSAPVGIFEGLEVDLKEVFEEC